MAREHRGRLKRESKDARALRLLESNGRSPSSCLRSKRELGSPTRNSYRTALKSIATPHDNTSIRTQIRAKSIGAVARTSQRLADRSILSPQTPLRPARPPEHNPGRETTHELPQPINEFSHRPPPSSTSKSILQWLLPILPDCIVVLVGWKMRTVRWWRAAGGVKVLALMRKDVGRFQGVCAGDAIVMCPSMIPSMIPNGDEDQGNGEAVLSMARCAKLPIHTHEAARIPMTRNVRVPACKTHRSFPLSFESGHASRSPSSAR